VPIANGARAALSFVTHLVIISLASASYPFILSSTTTHTYTVSILLCVLAGCSFSWSCGRTLSSSKGMHWAHVSVAPSPPCGHRSRDRQRRGSPRQPPLPRVYRPRSPPWTRRASRRTLVGTLEPACSPASETPPSSVDSRSDLPSPRRRHGSSAQAHVLRKRRPPAAVRSGTYVRKTPPFLRAFPMFVPSLSW
jgi:hypothetical protein